MAQKVEWSDSYLLGISEIDDQHKKLIAIANEFYNVVVSSADVYKAKMPAILAKLKDYTIYHFSHEEQFMQKFGYIGSAAQKTAHDGFIKEVEYHAGKISIEDSSSAAKFYDFIVVWILNHIAKADKVWAKFVKPQL